MVNALNFKVDLNTTYIPQQDCKQLSGLWDLWKDYYSDLAEEHHESTQFDDSFKWHTDKYVFDLDDKLKTTNSEK